eukprot:CAMPEP_0174850300 /NCGR_PEP_ID=MMETSP1114-20130205/19156_1 /TAXON_ID=312471 /ORGANISM="Neobodo designis, Strain CCAP 1951/1" /LENGTH=351 /DNA_ID=CAMNT_0016084755 /DNA_START=135 /DNA_END=1187 /DNA_ORIENTATION=+
MQGGIRDIDATSKHRTLGQVEWSRQLSREVKPFFVPVPTAESRVQLGTGVDRPRRHAATLDMERSAPKPVDNRLDARDYTPLLHEQLHPRCGVNIAKAPARGAVFAPPQHQSEVVVDVEMHPGWGRGKKSAMSRAARSPSPGFPGGPGTRSATASPSADEKVATRVYSAYTPIPEAPAFEAVESRLTRPKGGFIPRCDERKLTPAPDHAPLEPNFDIRKPNKAVINLSCSRRHFASKEKKSEEYRRKFQTPPPPPLSTPEPTRSTPGFAPQRQSFDRSVSSLLATADADFRRAKKLMQQNFGTRSRSSLRSAMLYTPSPSSSPGQSPALRGRLRPGSGSTYGGASHDDRRG